jgi:large subunit ribosomal protein L6
MSRVAKRPIEIPKGAQVAISGKEIRIKGAKGELAWTMHDKVQVAQEENELRISADMNDQKAVALAGTTRALLANMVQGVSAGFERKLELHGVGYRAQAQGKTLNLTQGFSHPVAYPVPEGITIETPSQTEIIVKGIDRQKVGQVAAEIRDIRPPEPYKGKGVRYAGEQIVMKEGKKK